MPGVLRRLGGLHRPPVGDALPADGSRRPGRPRHAGGAGQVVSALRCRRRRGHGRGPGGQPQRHDRRLCRGSGLRDGPRLRRGRSQLHRHLLDEGRRRRLELASDDDTFARRSGDPGRSRRFDRSRGGCVGRHRNRLGVRRSSLDRDSRRLRGGRFDARLHRRHRRRRSARGGGGRGHRGIDRSWGRSRRRRRGKREGRSGRLHDGSRRCERCLGREDGGARCGLRVRDEGRRRRHALRPTQRQHAERIDVTVRIGRDPDTEVDVRDRRDRVDAFANEAHDRSFGDDDTAHDARRAELQQRHRIAVGCLDRDRPASARNEPGERDRARSRSENRTPELGGDVDPAMLPARVLVRAERERSHHRPRGRPDPGVRRRRGSERRKEDQDREESPHDGPPLLGWRDSRRR